jgi:hypothetical protein
MKSLRDSRHLELGAVDLKPIPLAEGGRLSTIRCLADGREEQSHMLSSNTSSGSICEELLRQRFVRKGIELER